MITNVIFEFFMHAVWSNRMPDIWRDNNKWTMIKKPALLVIQRKKKWKEHPCFAETDWRRIEILVIYKRWTDSNK